MARQLIMVHFKEGGAVACLPVRLFDNGLKAEIRRKNTVIVAHNLGGRWVDNALYNEEIAASAAQGEASVAQESGESTPAAPVREYLACPGCPDKWCLINGVQCVPDESLMEIPAQATHGEEIAPAAPAINLSADVFNLDYSEGLPPFVFRGQSAQRCLIENIHLTADGATLEGTVHTPRGDLTVRVMRNMWLACAFSPIESEVK